MPRLAYSNASNDDGTDVRGAKHRALGGESLLH